MFVFVPHATAGHVHPMLPVVAELARRGHPVRVVVGRRWAPAVRRCGAEVVELAAVPDVFVPERLTGLASARFLSGRLRRVALHRRAAAVLDHHLRGLTDRAVLVVDPMLGWADRVARRHRLPTATFSTTFHQDAVTLAELARQDGRLLPRWVHRARPMARRSERPGRLTLANAVPAMQPVGSPLPRGIHLVGPLTSPVRPQPVPHHPPGHRVLLVSPGTVFARGAAFFHRFVRAFTGRPWQVFLATGHLDPAVLGPLPSNVVARRSLPQVSLLSRADVFVTHAGMNSVTEGLLAGVPMLLFPRCAEQRHLARRLVATGAGRWPLLDDAAPAALYAQVDALAGDEVARRAIGEWRSRLGRGAGPTRAADLLEAWLPGRPPE